VNAGIVNNLIARQLRLEEVRSTFEDSMQSAFNYVNPRRYDMTGSLTKGAKRSTKMYDGVAQDAFLDWVDGMLGWGVSESLKWQRAAILDRELRENDQVQRWLDDYTEEMEWAFRTSNFYDVLPEQLQDGGSGGTAVMLTEESDDFRIVHRVPHPGSYWIAENQDGDVDVYHEKVPLTARQALRKFTKPGDTLHPMVQTWAKDSMASLYECEFLTCICPADDPAIFERNQTIGRKKWAVVTILYSTASASQQATSTIMSGDPGDRLVRVQGLDYFLPTVWRFRRNSDEVYGFSPAMDVMSVIEAAQRHAYNLLMMGNYAADPIMAIPEEKRTGFSKLPGSRFLYGSEKRLPQPIQFGGEYPLAVDRENKLHDLIRKRYGWHVWNAVLGLQAKKERVQATEVVEVRADQARLLTGQFNNFWRGGIAPTYNNVAYVSARAGRLPPPPAVLQDKRGQDIVLPAFIGPLSQIQIASTKLSGVRQGMQLLGEIAEIVGRHVGPEEAAKIYARVRLPDLAEYVCDHSSFPQALMNDDEATQAVIAAREQRAAAAQEAQTMQRLAAASGQLGREPGQNSLLAQGAAA
jgi:hypothetical protein